MTTLRQAGQHGGVGNNTRLFINAIPPKCFANSKSRHWLRKQLATGFELLKGNAGFLWQHESIL